MSKFIGDQNIDAILKASQTFLKESLLSDKSIFTQKAIWSLDNLKKLQQCIGRNPDEGTDDFYIKLKRQLKDQSPDIVLLAAETYWALMLCPIPKNISIEKKTENIKTIWGWSNIPFPDNLPQLNHDILSGIGSAGTGFNTHLWNEILFALEAFISFKQLEEEKRNALPKDYLSFADWLDTIDDSSSRQFRHMILYLLFPERCERIFSKSERIKILTFFNKLSKQKESTLKKEEKPTVIDAELHKLRHKLEQEHGTKKLDYYLPPLSNLLAQARRNSGKNTIYFGPPGTGKTHTLQKLMKKYTDTHVVKSKIERIKEVIEGNKLSWYDILVMAMMSEKSVKVPALKNNNYITAKYETLSRTNEYDGTLYGNLCRAAKEECVLVNTPRSLTNPLVFCRDENYQWSVDKKMVEDELPGIYTEWQKLENAQEGSAGKVERYEFVTFHQSYAYEDFVEGIKPAISESSDAEGGGISYEIQDGIFKRLANKARHDQSHEWVIFIDEINRGNVAKIFGELITLIEPNKREEVYTTLPYSKEKFTVPKNLRIIATMNTADRSIDILDTALRRRFEFEELSPKPELLAEDEHKLEGIDLAKLLKTINRRIQILLDKDHIIGHSYFMGITNKNDPLPELQNIFRNNIIPLLEEYFFSDRSKIKLVLGKEFVKEDSIDARKEFDFSSETSLHDFDQQALYEITIPNTIEGFVAIYSKHSNPGSPPSTPHTQQ